MFSRERCLRKLETFSFSLGKPSNSGCALWLKMGFWTAQKWNGRKLNSQVTLTKGCWSIAQTTAIITRSFHRVWLNIVLFVFGRRRGILNRTTSPPIDRCIIYFVCFAFWFEIAPLAISASSDFTGTGGFSRQHFFIVSSTDSSRRNFVRTRLRLGSSRTNV